MTKEEIMNIRDYKEIFKSKDKGGNKRIYKSIMKEWHPDRYWKEEGKREECERVIKHINKLYEEYNNNIEKRKVYEEKRYEERVTGKEIRIRYIEEGRNEIGKIYKGKGIVVYEIEEGKEKYYKNYKESIKGLRYSDDKMRKEMEKYLPIRVRYREVVGSNLIVIEKGENEIMLRDIMRYYGGRIPIRTGSWIISSLMNIICYLEWKETVHNGITEDNIFIDMKEHKGLLLGGWWYSVREGERMIGCKKEIYEIMPFISKRDKKSSYKTDIESVRRIAREIFNTEKMEVPKPIIDYSRETVIKESAIEEYKLWNKVLDDTFGKKREFYKNEITYHEVYGI